MLKPVTEIAYYDACNPFIILFICFSFQARLLDRMSFVYALPSFKMKQWQVIVLLFVEALSVHRLPSLGPQMTRSMLL